MQLVEVKTAESQRVWLHVAGPVALIAGLIASWVASTRYGHDYASIYATARGILENSPIYDPAWQKIQFAKVGLGPPNGLFYPPATGFATILLGVMPYGLAHDVWLALMVGAMVLGVRSLVQLARPEAPSYTWQIAAAVVLLSSCVRWGMTIAQGAPLIMGLLCLFVVALHRGLLWQAALLAAFATAFKVTLALPFLGLLFFYRRYGVLAAVLGTWVLLNAIGFARLGGMSALHAYQHNIQGLELLDDINSPDPWRLVALPRLDWIFLLYGVTGNLPLARLGTLLLGAAVGLFLLWQVRRVRQPELTTTAVVLLVLVCLTNTVVYHHHYDVSLIAAPLVLWWAVSSRPVLPSRAIMLAVPLLVIVTFWPVATLHHFALDRFGPIGWGLMNLVYPVVTTLAMIGGLVMLRALMRNLRAPTAPQAQPS
jgi:hypothetical protein